LKIIALSTVNSTNQYALDNFDAIDDGTLITADEQTNGRGRRGRTWLSSNENNLYASFVIKNICQHITHFSWLASLATIQTIEEYSHNINDLWIKWPNDIFCTHRKIAGSLCEIKNDEKNIAIGLIIGIGVNLNMSKKSLDNIDQPATSLSVEIDEKIDKNKFVKIFFNKLIALYEELKQNNSQKLYTLWKNNNLLIGKRTTVLMDNSKSINGEILDIDYNGHLIFKTQNKIISLCSGDVTIDKQALLKIFNKTKVLRKGFSTGTCLIATVKQAVLLYLNENQIANKEVKVLFPDKKYKNIKICEQKIEKDKITVSVIKDAGDDPDVTHNAKIEISLTKNPLLNATDKDYIIKSDNINLVLTVKSGVGLVTQNGLNATKGKWAKNNGPREMLISN